MTAPQPRDIPLINGWVLGHRDALYMGEMTAFPVLYRDGLPWMSVGKPEAEMLLALAGRITELESALRAVEYPTTGTMFSNGRGGFFGALVCGVCRAVKGEGHTPDCLVGLALAGGTP